MTKFICGVAYNSKGKYKSTEHSKHTAAYTTWRNMLERCYSEKKHKAQPTYVNASVGACWLDFQDFAEWFYNHPYSDKQYQLDKDLLFEGNKIYSPDYCCFVPAELNSLLNDCRRSRGKYPQGVSWRHRDSKYLASMGINGKQKILGTFDCPNKAYQTYKAAKEAHVKTKALEWKDRIDEDIFNALMSWQLTN